MTRQFGMGLLALTTSASVALAGTAAQQAPGGQDGMQSIATSFKPGQGITFDGGDEWYLNIRNAFQVGFAHSTGDGASTNNFSIRRARTRLSGHVFDRDIKYRVELDWVSTTVDALDAWVQWNFYHDDNMGDVGLRLGLTKQMFGREFTGDYEGLAFINRSISDRTFNGNRSLGAMFVGEHMDGQLQWNFGFFNQTAALQAQGAGFNTRAANNDGNELGYVAGINFNVLGDVTNGRGREDFIQDDLENTQDLALAVGAGYEFDNSQATTAGAPDVELSTVNLNAHMKVSGISVMGEVFIHSADPQNTGATKEDATGWMLQTTYAMPKGDNDDIQWAFGGRVSMVTIDDAPAQGIVPAALFPGVTALGAAGDILEITGGVTAYYRGPSLRSQVNLTYLATEPDAGADVDDLILDLQLTAIF